MVFGPTRQVMEPITVEDIREIAELGGYLGWYQLARNAGCSHGELVEIAGLGGRLGWYRLARAAGAATASWWRSPGWVGTWAGTGWHGQRVLRIRRSLTR